MSFKLTIKYINERIKQEICYDTLRNLSDSNLMEVYKECDSVKNRIQAIKNYTDDKTIQKIIEGYLLHDNLLIPPGTKGVIRGNTFNKLVKQFIEKLELNTEHIEICFEKNCPTHVTDERPDWYILEKSNNKIMIGMNQLDLWSGGHQLNRGFKYIKNNVYNKKNSKLVCVVCNETQLKSKTKIYELFESGFKNNTLCYLNNLENIIRCYFN
jgi:hypothetical protein